MITSDARLQLTPPSSRSITLTWALTLAAPVLATIVTLSVKREDGLHHLAWPWLGNAFEQPTLALIACLFAGFGLLGWALTALMRRQRVDSERSRLTITSGMRRCKIAMADLALAQARVVDLDEHTELKPMLKSNGMSVPGYRSGWFYLRNRRRCFVATSTSPRILWLPGHGKHDLLLDVKDPAALLAHLRQLAQPSHSN